MWHFTNVNARLMLYLSANKYSRSMVINNFFELKANRWEYNRFYTTYRCIGGWAITISVHQSVWAGKKRVVAINFLVLGNDQF